MNFNYAMLITLQDANGKNHINGIENFFSKRVRAQELRLVLLLPPERLRA